MKYSTRFSVRVSTIVCGFILFTLMLGTPMMSPGEEPQNPANQLDHDITRPHLRHTPQEMRIRHERARASTKQTNKSFGDDVELGGSNESSVAVNPLDQDNVAYASLVELRVSNDGGVTFESGVLAPFPPTHMLAGDPVVAFDSEGRLFWQYLGYTFDGGLDVFIVQCDPRTGEILDGYPVNVSEQVGLGGIDGHISDKS